MRSYSHQYPRSWSLLTHPLPSFFSLFSFIVFFFPTFSFLPLSIFFWHIKSRVEQNLGAEMTRSLELRLRQACVLNVWPQRCLPTLTLHLASIYTDVKIRPLSGFAVSRVRTGSKVQFTTPLHYAHVSNMHTH